MASALPPLNGPPSWLERRAEGRERQSGLPTNPHRPGSCSATGGNNPRRPPFGRRHIVGRPRAPQNGSMASVEFGRTISGLPVEPLYTGGGVGGPRELPGQVPYTRGIPRRGYRGRLLDQGQVPGLGNP